MMEQRELIRKKKMEERKEELTAFVENVNFSLFRNKQLRTQSNLKSVRRNYREEESSCKSLKSNSKIDDQYKIDDLSIV